MHLLFDATTYAWLGQVQEQGGRIEGVWLTSKGDECLLDVWEKWGREGISIIKPLPSLEERQRKTVFVRERTPFSSPEAFQAFVFASSKHGFFVSTLDDRLVSCWEDIKVWPISDMAKYNLVFAMRNLKSEEFPLWKKEWPSLAKQMSKV